MIFGEMCSIILFFVLVIVGFIPIYGVCTIAPCTTGFILVYTGHYHYICDCDKVQQDYDFISCDTDRMDCSEVNQCEIRTPYNEDLCLGDKKYETYYFYKQFHTKDTTMIVIGAVLLSSGLFWAIPITFTFCACLFGCSLTGAGIPF